MIERPAIGQTIRVTIHGATVPARVLKVHPFGTVDVERLSDGKAFRLSGLGWI